MSLICIHQSTPQKLHISPLTAPLTQNNPNPIDDVSDVFINTIRTTLKIRDVRIILEGAVRIKHKHVGANQQNETFSITWFTFFGVLMFNNFLVNFFLGNILVLFRAVTFPTGF